MNRRTAITAAAVVSGTLFAGATASALSSGVFLSDADDGIGDLDPVVSAVPLETVGQPPVVTVGPSPAPQPTASDPVTTSGASSVAADDRYEDDDEYEDDEYDDDDEHHDDEHEEYEYEGYEDDD